MESNRKFDIYERSFSFALKTGKFVKRIPKDMILNEYSRQLIRSSGSIGANLGEADGALTRKDFINKVGIARREAKESHHWLKLIEGVADFDRESDLLEINWLIKESKELLLILSSIIRNSSI